MPWEQVFAILRDVAMSAAWVLVFVVRRESARIDERFTKIEARLEQQSLEKLRDVFLSMDVVDVMAAESRKDRSNLWVELNRLRDAVDRDSRRRAHGNDE